MTDEDIRRMVREFRAAVASELETVHSRIDGIGTRLDGLVARIDGMEAGIMNELRSLGRRVGRLEER